MKIFSVAEMVAAEKAADAAGNTYDQMMERAGKAVADALIARGEVAGRRVLVLVGPGNNGGDGLVAAHYLAEAGAEVACYLSHPRDPAADANLARLHAQHIMVLEAGLDQRFRVLRHRLNITDVVIDALLGTGVARPIQGELGQLMRQVAAGLAERADVLSRVERPVLTAVASLRPPPAPRPLVVAVDCPSGLNCDSGALDPLTVPADVTVTFAGPKRGHFLFPGAGACGRLWVADIGIGPELGEVADVALELVTAESVRALLPARPPDGHKGTFGTALIGAGQAEYWGAPVLAGRAALRAGAGLVALAVPVAIRPTVAAQLPEAIFPPVPDAETLGTGAAAFLADRLAGERVDALLLGPGLGPAGPLFEALLARDGLPPLVVDADGLNALAALPDWPRRLPPGSVLTPHPGEMARLTGIPLDELLTRDRVALAREQAQAWGHILLLKGAYSVVASPDRRTALLPFANPVLAVGGSGDVLAGLIVSLMAQGMAAYEAALAGGFLHGAAAELAGRVTGRAGVLAGEIADYVPLARHQLEADFH